MSSIVENRSLSDASLNRPSSPNFQSMQERNAIYKSISDCNATLRVNANAVNLLDSTITTATNTIVAGSMRAPEVDTFLNRAKNKELFPHSLENADDIVDQPLASPRMVAPPRRSAQKLQVQVPEVECCESEGFDTEEDSGYSKEDGKLEFYRRNSQRAIVHAPVTTPLLPTALKPDDNNTSESLMPKSNEAVDAFFLA